MASELAFRAQLILREQRELYDHWSTRARGRLMPSRADIDPIALPHLLPGLSILDAGEGINALKYRAAGTRVREIYGLEVTGRAFFDLDLGAKRGYWHSVYRQILDERIPMQGAVRCPASDRDHLLLLWLRLPLAEDEAGVSKIIGYDASIPSRLALVPRPAIGDAA